MVLDNQEKTEEYKPRWAHRAEYIDSKPDWIDFIPHELWELGSVFFPIPRGKKGDNYKHSLEENRYEADSEVLNAYLEAGSNYGIACAGDLAVLDIDDLDYFDELTDNLPETLYQKTGSGTGYHLFYYVPGLDSRKNLYVYICRNCTEDIVEFGGYDNDLCPHCGVKYDDKFERKHIGEVKCDPHGYVVGPGSVHPSGNKYGPLKGDEIRTVEREEFLDAIDLFVVKDEKVQLIKKQKEEEYRERRKEMNKRGGLHNFYKLTTDDILPWLGEGKRISHPVHGSETGKNFMKNGKSDTFVCWRCQYGVGDGCGINPQQFLAIEKLGNEGKAGDFICQEVRRNWPDDPVLTYKAWARAVDQGLIDTDWIPYRVKLGYAINEGFVEYESEFSGEVYEDVTIALRYEIEYLWR